MAKLLTFTPLEYLSGLSARFLQTLNEVLYHTQSNSDWPVVTQREVLYVDWLIQYNVEEAIFIISKPIVSLINIVLGILKK